MNLEEMMKAATEAAENIKREMEGAQAKLDTVEVEGAAGGGMVRIRCTAKGRVVGVTIDPSLLTVDDKDMLEDLIAAAFNDARAKGDAASSAEMAKMTSGMQLPPGFKLPI